MTAPKPQPVCPVCGDDLEFCPEAQGRLAGQRRKK